MVRAETPISVVDEIRQYNRGGKPRLVRIKFARMSGDAFAFFRGADHLLARLWKTVRPRDVGPEILICGDLHLENFGAYRSENHEFLFDINDFDEALIAPCSIDLVRCTTSIILGATLWGLSPVDTAGMALTFIDQYRAAVTESVASGVVGEVALGEGSGPIWDLLGATALGNQIALLDHMTEKSKSGARRIIRSVEKRPELSEKRAKLVRAAVEQYGKSTKTPKAYKVIDVTGRIAGVGSLGQRRYCVLVKGEGSHDTNWLLDVKEERTPALLPIAGKAQSRVKGDEALRVVQAQRQLQAKPMARLDVLEIDGSSYRMRELIPDENRANLDRLHSDPHKLRAGVGVAGRLAGWSQLRGCRVAGEDHSPALAHWAKGTALDAVLAASMRYADQTERDYEVFQAAYVSGKLID